MAKKKFGMKKTDKSLPKKPKRSGGKLNSKSVGSPKSKAPFKKGKNSASRKGKK